MNLKIITFKLWNIRCGKLFCDVHTRFQVRLSLDLRYDSQNGYWARVCQFCYESRQGYNDYYGINITMNFLIV